MDKYLRLSVRMQVKYKEMDKRTILPKEAFALQIFFKQDLRGKDVLTEIFSLG
jgi:hypothetical protein